MISFKIASTLSNFALKEQNAGKVIGFVPTMGALHQGHLSLIAAAKKQCDVVICSIFVNPTQFNNSKDFEKYPITIEQDLKLLHDAHCDAVFLPNVAEIYPNGTTNLKHYDLGFLETVYDGAFRPGHFQGVCNVVERLFNIVQPNHAFFGLKDYQQCMVISKLVDIMGWQKRLQLHFCDTLREPHGLAMSSRNTRLSSTERNDAAIIYTLLTKLKASLPFNDIEQLRQDSITILEQKGYKVDYFDLADAYTLAPVINWDGVQKIVCLVAIFIGEVRLIDNMVLN